MDAQRDGPSAGDGLVSQDRGPGGQGPPGRPEPWMSVRSFAADASSLSAVRAWVREELARRGWCEVGDVVELLVSELATNAVRHTRTGLFTVRVQAVGSLEVAVHDVAGQVPVPRRAGAWDEDGRGLALVEALADDWGARTVPGGKWVWFRLRGR